jgi:hypothetical protein
MKSILCATILAVAGAFNFGGITIPIPSLPPLPSIPELPTIVYPSVPVLPSIPTDINSLPSIDIKVPSFPQQNFTSRLPIPSIPALPSFPSLPPFPSFDLPSIPALPTALPVTDINNALKSLGVSAMPSMRIPSIPPAIPTFQDLLGNGRDTIADLADYWNKTRSGQLPTSQDELKQFLQNNTRFDFKRADEFVDRLGSDLGTDIHGPIRMISGLVLQNLTVDEVYKRTTAEFSMVTTRLRDLAHDYNFTQIRLPPILTSLAENATLSIIQFTKNPYSTLSRIQPNTSVVSIMIGDLYSGNETAVRDLDQLINFTLPLAEPIIGDQRDAVCMFWNTTDREWSAEGCKTLGVSLSSVQCGCNHLTDFAAMLTPIIVAPSPLIASLSPIVASSSPIPVLRATASASFNPVLEMAQQVAAASSGGGLNPSVTAGLAAGGATLVLSAIGLIYLNKRHADKKRRIKAISPLPTVNPVVARRS